MRLARIRTDEGILMGEYDDGRVEADGTAYLVGEDAELLAPCDPSTMYCVGRNYAVTIDEMGYERPEAPSWFLKPPASLHPPGAPIEYPAWTEELSYAGELAAVIDERCSDLNEDEVDGAIRGYTIMNDLDALDQEGVTARKAFDGSGPLGPWIETDLDPTGLDMTTKINGETTQEANTADMIFPPREVISHLSARYTFRPGDVVAFGGPSSPGALAPDDEIEMYYEGIGTLRNTVAESG